MRKLPLFLVFAGCAGITPDVSPIDLGPAGDGARADLRPDQVYPPHRLGSLRFDLGEVDQLATGLPLGMPCARDAECSTSLCRNASGRSVCVRECQTAADCPSPSFCEAQAAGLSRGYCIPPSPLHCASCEEDRDCGGLAERCLQPSGESGRACHIDCALAGDTACPPDYRCTSVQEVGGRNRRLCRPAAGRCLDALGGYCGLDRMALPQRCVSANLAGQCSGQRACLAPPGRYDRCDAPAPHYKTSCSELDPAGCELRVYPSVVATVDNCGRCGAACPGLGQATAEVSCVDPAAERCSFTCRGENYDVDRSPWNGCERFHPTPPGHTQLTAAWRGSRPCDDGASQDSFSSLLLSDARAHLAPPIDRFNAAVGSAPDLWAVWAAGGLFCWDDYAVTLSTTGGGSTPCYRLTVTTNKGSQSVIVTGRGSATLGAGASSYSDGTPIYFTIEKVCSLPVQETVQYTVSYHL